MLVFLRPSEINLEFRNVDFYGGKKPKYPEKNA
jgi:hypothetical protein